MKVALAILIASIAASAITTIGLWIVGATQSDAMSADSPSAFLSYFIGSTIVAVLVSSTIGLAWHAFASRRGWTNVHAYFFPGLLVGIAPPLMMFLWPVIATGQWLDTYLSLWTMLMIYGASLGGLTGIFAWAIRRPDRG